jgi:Leucine-rich repeat (LRR) protein
MSPEVGWELLCKSMNITEDFEVQNFRDIGLEIVRLCGGLPLAIKVTASVLGTKERNENEWRKVINKSAWSMIKLPIDLRGALYLSYDELPRHLKQCFLYCGLYPEDSALYCDELIRFWIAEGFVEEQETELLEDTAEDYYKELMYRNLLQPDPRFADYSRCKMHDLLRQLAQHLAGEGFFCGNSESMETKSLSKLRHISIVTGNEFLVAPGIKKEQIGVRTLTTKCKALKVENTIFKRLPKVHVLDLSGSVIVSIPDCIGKLIHLRSLVLDGTDISYLPESIGCLINLQILNLERCVFLNSLPSGITQLCNLRRLGLANTPIDQVPKGIGRLEFLSDLEGFPIGCACDNSTRMQNGWNLEELGPLRQLKKLDMAKLERAASCITDSLLTGKRYLKILNLHCTSTNEPYSEDDVINIEKTFEKLVPPHSLENLGIYDFFGRKYPSWVGATTHLSSLKYLQLTGCKSSVHLPPLGQLPSLKYLNIKEAIAVTKIGSEFLGYGVSNPRSAEAVCFPKLEMLILVDMPEWEEWTWASSIVIEQEEAAVMSKEGGKDTANAQQTADALPRRMQLLPQLNRLELVHCPKLRSLPWRLGHIATRLKELHIRDVTSIKLVEDLSFLSGYLLIANCDNLERVSNIPHVQELRVGGCPSLMCVEKLDNLRLLGLHESMQEISQLWLPGLQQQCRQLHREDLDVFNWT